MPRRPRQLVLAFTVSAAAAAFVFATLQAQQPAAGVAIDPDDIGGVVTGPKGPEAGVRVIAETRDLPVRYIKSVVTDDQGRFVVPDLPAATYAVWARGYGLVDSDKSSAKPGQRSFANPNAPRKEGGYNKEGGFKSGAAKPARGYDARRSYGDLGRPCGEGRAGATVLQLKYLPWWWSGLTLPGSAKMPLALSARIAPS